MLEFEVAALYYFIDNMLKINAYFNEVPENLLLPCIYYPEPDQDGDYYSLNTYRTEFTMYVNIMAKSDAEAYEIASKIVQEVLYNKMKIPMVDDNGSVKDKSLRLNLPKLKRIDNGVYQIDISWYRYTLYKREEVVKAQEFFMNKLKI